MFYLIIQFITSLCVQGTRPIITLFTDQQGVSLFVIGLLISTASLLPIIFGIHIGKWIDHYGAYKTTCIGTLCLLGSLGLPAIFPDISFLFISQMLVGLGMLFFGIAFQKTVANLPGNRDNIISITTFNSSAASFLGPLCSGFIYQYLGFQVLFGLCTICILLNFLFILSKGKAPWSSDSELLKKSKRRKQSKWQLLKNKKLRNVIIIGALINKGMFISFFPVYGNQIGLSPSQIGLILAVFSGAGMIARFLQFWLVRIAGREIVLFSILILSSCSYISLSFTTSELWFYGLAGILGATLGLGAPLSLVYALNLTSNERHGEMLGLRTSVTKTMQWMTPIVFSGAGAMIGFVSIFWGSSFLLLIGAYLTIPFGQEERKRDLDQNIHG